MSSLDVRAIDDKGLREAPSPKAVHGYRVFLAENAFDRAVERGASDTSREIGGILVGELLRDEAGPYLLIEDTVDALHADEKGAELTFTHATWEHINKEMDTRHQGKQVVGWYHTHPGFGVFLSDRDQFIHKSFFNLPFQVAFVYDPKTREHGMFTWHDNEVVRSRRYWIGSREQLWDGARVNVDPRKERDERRDTKPVERKPEGSDEPPLGMAALIVTGVLLLLVGGILGHLFASWSAGRQLDAARIEIAKAKQEGAQLALGSLQTELVGILRATLGDAAVRKPVLAAITELDAAIAGLEGGGSADPQKVATTAKTLRESLMRLGQDRASAFSVLAQLELVARQGESRDSAHEIAEQRAGLGALYAELALDIAKGGDLGRARRLFTMAARLDPGNRARYEKQLQTYDKSASLPAGTTAGSEGTR
jgi:proteasome lid subunit RPN8/RPN11